MTPDDAASLADQILDLLRLRGGAAYFGEDVTQREHALQAAALAVEAGASDALVIAALLHDIGHLLHDEDETVADRGLDTRHEELGDRFLVRFFGQAITEPVRLHVAAKRYLCAVDPHYADGLSQASRTSLSLQGGPMTPEEASQFAASPWARDAAGLRRWDDTAKVPGLAVPDLDAYRSRLLRLLEAE